MVRDNVRVCEPRFLLVGAGASQQVGQVLDAIGEVRAPLIVTDRTLVQMGIATAITKRLEASGYRTGVFDDISPDPTMSSVLKGIQKLEAGSHDCVVAVGGGSPLDAAKAIAVFSQHSRELEDYRPPKEFNFPGVPLVAIPTTAGTGSEVTHHTVLINDATGEKISCRGEAFVPIAAIVDYELTLKKPKRLTADNALDTLTHAIEAFVSPKRTMFSDRMALDSMRLVGKYLKRAYERPDDREAREGLMLAATFGGLAFTNASVGLVHGMSRPLGATFHVPHGMSNAMLLPALTEFALEAAPDRYAECARTVGFADGADSDETAGRKLVDGLRSWNRLFEVPTLRTFGVDEGKFLAESDRMADEALISGAPRNTPRVASKEDIVRLFGSVFREA